MVIDKSEEEARRPGDQESEEWSVAQAYTTRPELHRVRAQESQRTRWGWHGHGGTVWGTMSLHTSKNDYLKKSGVKPDPEDHIV